MPIERCLFCIKYAGQTSFCSIQNKEVSPYQSKCGMFVLNQDKVDEESIPNNGTAPLRSKYLVTDLANAERFVKKYKGDVLFISAWQKWVVWNGKVWEVMPLESMHELAHAVIMGMYNEIPTIRDDNNRAFFAKNVPKCESGVKIEGMLGESKPYLLEKPENFDTNQMMFVVSNGVLNLETLQLEPHDKQRRVMKMSNIVYEPTAKCPKWDDTLLKAFRGNQETIRFFQKACGYSMSGSQKEQCMFIQWGEGANMKSTTQEVISYIMGSYSQEMAISTIQEKDRNNHGANPELAVLAGSRFVRTGENNESFKLSEGLIKQITSGNDGKITCRKLYENDSSFIVEFKLWVSTNHKPQIKGTDYAIWRRVRLIPYLYTVPINERIQDYHKVIIKEESSGILNWMLEGLRLWKLEGLGTCPEVEEATNAFRVENDTIQRFINECCDVRGNYSVGSQQLYDVYVNDFCIENGEQPLQTPRFKEKLEEKGFKQTRKNKGILYIGIKIKGEYDMAGLNVYDRVGEKHNLPKNDVPREFRLNAYTVLHTPDENNPMPMESADEMQRRLQFKDMVAKSKLTPTSQILSK